LVITTNYPDRLDPALIRPGRIDVRIDFGKATRSLILEMVNNFYAATLPITTIPEELHKALTPAEVMECLCAHFRDSDAAIQHLVAKVRAPKQRIAEMICSTPLDDAEAVETIVRDAELELEQMSPMELTVEEVSEQTEVTCDSFPPKELLAELEADNTTEDRIAEIIKARQNDIAQIQQYREAPESLELLQKEIEEAPNGTDLLRGYINRLDDLQVEYCDDGMAPY
jgi:SpoVK/Ycf46/Vps4 family AAA+-type ATPase